MMGNLIYYLPRMMLLLELTFLELNLLYIWSRREIRRSFLLDLVLREIKGLQFSSILKKRLSKPKRFRENCGATISRLCLRQIHMIVGERGNNKMTLVRKVIGPGDGLGGKGVVHLDLKLVRSFLTPKPGLRVLFGFGGCFLVYFSFWFLRCHSGGEN